MAAEIIPSKFSKVHRDTKIRECLRLMKESKSSFILVQKKNGVLEGIFTLKDLLRSFDQLKLERNLERPVASIMSRPVRTIGPHQLNRAAEIMVRHSIRHLPVVADRGESSEKIIGVVDGESLLKANLVEKKTATQPRRSISVFSPNGLLFKLLKNTLKNQERIEVEKMWASKLRSDEQVEAYLKNFDLFFFNLVDSKSLRIAARMTGEATRLRKKMVMLINPGQFAKGEEQKIFAEIKKNKRVRVFEKPVNVHDIIFECID